jgi:hypothetical protein
MLISIFLNVKNVLGNYIQYNILFNYSLLVFMAYTSDEQIFHMEQLSS